MSRNLVRSWRDTNKFFDGLGVFPAIGLTPVVGLGIHAVALWLAADLSQLQMWLIYIAASPVVVLASIFLFYLLLGPWVRSVTAEKAGAKSQA